MIKSTQYIIGAAVYDTLCRLALNEDYIAAVEGYDFKIGFDEFKADETEEEPEKDTPEWLAQRLHEHPNICAFLYNGAFPELVRIYNTRGQNVKGKRQYAYRYLGVWNLLPQKAERSKGVWTFDTKVMIIAPVKKDYTTEQREQKLFRPILDVFADTLIGCITDFPYVRESGGDGLEYEVRRGYNTLGLYHDEIGDYISALQLDMTLRVVEYECERHEQEIIDKYNNLIKLLTQNL